MENVGFIEYQLNYIGIISKIDLKSLMCQRCNAIYLCVYYESVVFFTQLCPIECWRLSKKDQLKNQLKRVLGN